MLSLNEVAAICNVSRRTLYRRRSLGQFPSPADSNNYTMSQVRDYQSQMAAYGYFCADRHRQAMLSLRRKLCPD